MVSLVFIQTHPQEGRMPLNETAYSLWYGCRQLGMETRFYHAFQDIRAEVAPETLVHGGVGNVRAALRHLGVPDPAVSEVPSELQPWYGRKFWTSTLGDIRNRTSSEVFIKPLREHKAFNGHVVSDKIRTLIYTAGLPDDMGVLCSEPVVFLSEYRAMVHHGLIVACRHYAGDCTLSPNFDLVRKMVLAFTQAPVAYSLDVGVTSEGSTLVVEVNDAFSLGSYGTPSIQYTQMVIDRWKQMVSSQ